LEEEFTRFVIRYRRRAATTRLAMHVTPRFHPHLRGLPRYGYGHACTGRRPRSLHRDQFALEYGSGLGRARPLCLSAVAQAPRNDDETLPADPHATRAFREAGNRVPRTDPDQDRRFRGPRCVERGPVREPARVVDPRARAMSRRIASPVDDVLVV